MIPTEDVIVVSRTNNEFARVLDGVPKRPENVPESIVKAVEVFAQAMIDKKFWNGWFGDTSKPFFDDCVNAYLQLPHWSNKERVRATLFSDLDNAVKYTKVPRTTLEQIVTYCGYSIDWSESTFCPVKSLITIAASKKPLQAVVLATEESLAKMKALLTSKEPYSADDLSQIVSQLNTVYSAHLAQPELPALPDKVS